MNILLISTYNTECGIATYTKNLVRELAKEHKVFILAELEPKAFAPLSYTDKDTSARVFKTWKRNNPYGADFGLSSIVNFLKTNNFKPDIIHIQHEFGIFPNDDAFFTLLQELTGLTKSKVITFHTISRPPINIGFFSKLENYIVKTVAHTPAGHSVLSKPPGEFGIHSIHALIPHGCPSPEAPGYKFAEHVTILCPGFISPSKGHEELIESFARAWPNFEKNPATLYIVGLCRDTSYLNRLQSQIKNYNLEQNIVIDEGFKTEQEMTKYLGSANIILLGGGKTSPYSASGQLAQAIGAQLPVIAKNIPIYRSQNSEKVLLFSDKTECALFIQQLVNNEKLREKLGKHEGFPTWVEVTKKHINLYNT